MTLLSSRPLKFNLPLLQNRLEGLEKAATLLAPMRDSLKSVSVDVNDVWGAKAATPAVPNLASFLRCAPDSVFHEAAARQRKRRQKITQNMAGQTSGGWSKLRALLSEARGSGVGAAAGMSEGTFRARLVEAARVEMKAGDDQFDEKSDGARLTLAARVAQLEKLANRHSRRCVCRRTPYLRDPTDTPTPPCYWTQPLLARSSCSISN